MMIKNFLYFDSDVVDEVYSQLGGEFTKDQIADVMDCSVGYLHHVMTYTDCISLYIPKIGYVHVNKEEMIKRKTILDRNRASTRGAFSKSIKDEMKAMNEKLKHIDDEEYNIVPVKCDMPLAVYRLRSFRPWSKTQSFQNNIKF